MKSVIYKGIIYSQDAKDLPEEAREKLGIKTVRKSKSAKPKTQTIKPKSIVKEK